MTKEEKKEVSKEASERPTVKDVLSKISVEDEKVLLEAVRT